MRILRAVPVSPSELLAHIKPHRVILSVCTRGNSVGFALSDGYFSHASPLRVENPPSLPLADARWWAALLREHSVGAFAFTLPVGLQGPAADAAKAERVELLRTLSHIELSEGISEAAPAGDGSSGAAFALLADSVSLCEARKLAHEQPELWEDVAPFLHGPEMDGAGPLSDAACAAHAAISTNHFLWVECEGWARNTFG